MSTKSLAIDLEHVAKTYRGKVHALRGIKMKVRKGEIYGLLGPNGAGKSTLVKILMSVVRPTRARGEMLGKPVGHKGTLERVGYLPENHRFPGYLTGRQSLLHFAGLAKVSRSEADERADQLLERVGMAEAADRKIKTYSKGMMQRVGLAQALMNDPDLIFLDEPTDGVDPLGRHGIRQMLAGLRDEGKTVFVNSHQLGEVEQVCDRVAILLSGQVVREGSLADLTGENSCYEVRLGGKDDPTKQAEKALGGDWGNGQQELGKIVPTDTGAPPAVRTGRGPTGLRLELAARTLRVEGADATNVQPILDKLRQADLVIESLQPIRMKLEDVFIQAMGDQANAVRQYGYYRQMPPQPGAGYPQAPPGQAGYTPYPSQQPGGPRQ